MTATLTKPTFEVGDRVLIGRRVEDYLTGEFRRMEFDNPAHPNLHGTVVGFKTDPFLLIEVDVFGRVSDWHPDWLRLEVAR